jgi:hypothetical protein
MNIEVMKRALEYLQENEGCIADVSSSQYVKEYYEFMERFAGVIKQAEQKTAVSPDGGKGFIDGVWHCQCGKAYEVTCISSKPKEKSWKSWA